MAFALDGSVTGGLIGAGIVLAAGCLCRICPNCSGICGDHESSCPHCRCALRCPNCNNKCGKQASCANCGVAIHGGWGLY